MPDPMTEAARLAACAELGWRDADGALHAMAFTPLVIADTVVVALPFDQTTMAQLLSGATAAVLTLSDSRMALRGWTPLAQRVAVTVEADRDGDWTWTGALDQLVRKYPPARLLIDTPIQRREHWWYVPRWLVRLRPERPAVAVPRRAPDDAVLFGDIDGRFTARCVAVDDWDAARMYLSPLQAPPDRQLQNSDAMTEAGRPPPDATLDDRSAQAVALAHTFSIPDMQRWSSLTVTGVRRGRRLEVQRRDGRLALDPPAGVVRRLARHWRRERACRRALAAYDDSPRVAM